MVFLFFFFFLCRCESTIYLHLTLCDLVQSNSPTAKGKIDEEKEKIEMDRFLVLCAHSASEHHTNTRLCEQLVRATLRLLHYLSIHPMWVNVVHLVNEKWSPRKSKMCVYLLCCLWVIRLLHSNLLVSLLNSFIVRCKSYYYYYYVLLLRDLLDTRAVYAV